MVYEAALILSRYIHSYLFLVHFCVWCGYKSTFM